MPPPSLDSRAGCAPQGGVHAFAISAAQDPQVMLRVTGLFAQRSILPHQLNCRKSGDSLLIDVEAELESDAAATVLLEKLRSIVLVEHAELVEEKL